MITKRQLLDESIRRLHLSIDEEIRASGAQIAYSAISCIFLEQFKALPVYTTALLKEGEHGTKKNGLLDIFLKLIIPYFTESFKAFPTLAQKDFDLINKSLNEISEEARKKIFNEYIELKRSTNLCDEAHVKLMLN